MEAFLQCVSLYHVTTVSAMGYAVLSEGDDLHEKD